MDSIDECAPYLGYRLAASGVPPQCWQIVLGADPELRAYDVSAALDKLDARNFPAQREHVRRAALCRDTVVVAAAVDAADRFYDVGGETILTDLVRTRFGDVVEPEEVERGREALHTSLDGLALMAWYRLTDGWPPHLRQVRDQKRAAGSAGRVGE